MSGDQHRDNDPEQDDVDFEQQPPKPGLHDLFEPGRAKAAQPAGDADEAAGAEDVLFQQEQVEATEQFAGREQFDENSPARWGGHRLSADDIGIPVEGEEPPVLSDDLTLDSEAPELQLVDDDRDLDVAGGDADAELFVLDEPDEAGADELGAPDEAVVLEDGAEDDVREGGTHPADDENETGDGAGGEVGTFLADEPLPEDSYPVEEGWEPLAENAAEDGETAGESQEPLAEEEQELAAVAADGEDAGLYVDATPAHVVGAPRRGRRFLAVIPSLLAATIVVGAGAVVVLRPEWLGLHFQPQLVERVQVQRPSVDVRVPAPPMPAERPVTATNPPPVVPPVGTHPPVVPPVGTDPPPVVPPDGTDPGLPPPVVPPPVVPPEVQRPAPDADRTFLPVGDTMWIGSYEPVRPAGEGWSDIPIGSKAFAQLRNGNFFIGSIKGAASDALVLKVDTGEITLARGEIEKITTLDSAEYAALQKATSGFIRLNNQNRLAGSILKSVVDDNYVLQMRSDRIVVPRSVVDRVVESGDSGALRFGAGQDEEEWLRDLATRQLHAMATGERQGTSRAPAQPDGKKAPQAAPRAPRPRPGH